MSSFDSSYSVVFAAMSPGGMARSQSEPSGGSPSAADVLKSTGKYAEDDDPILKTLKPSPVKKRNPNQKWDGRVSGMSVQEYRERKWSVDACYSKVERRGPSYSMRRMVPSYFGKKNNNFQVGDVFRGMNATMASSPSYSMGVQPFLPPRDKSQGPAEYAIQSTMDPSKHPTISKHCGARFGSEVLEPRDPTGPAPGDYDPNAIIHSSTLKKPPNFTIQGREAWAPRTTAPGPGVGEYPFEHCMRTGKLSPIHWGMQGKTEPLDPPLGSKQFETPGPAHYKCPGGGGNTDAYKSQAPIYKFSSEARGLRN